MCLHTAGQSPGCHVAIPAYSCKTFFFALETKPAEILRSVAADADESRMKPGWNFERISRGGEGRGAEKG